MSCAWLVSSGATCLPKVGVGLLLSAGTDEQWRTNAAAGAKCVAADADARACLNNMNLATPDRNERRPSGS